MCTMATNRPGWAVTVIVIPVMLTVFGGLLFMDESPIWWKKLFSRGFEGGCEPYMVYAQNRWNPYGAAVRLNPDPESPKIGGYSPNEIIVVDGWLHAKVAYPTNQGPWNSDIWFHLANDPGWVSFAGVRGVPTSPDPTGFAEDGGQPARTPTICEGRLR